MLTRPLKLPTYASATFAPSVVPKPGRAPHQSPLVNDVFRQRLSYVPQRLAAELPKQLMLDDNTNVYGCSLRAKQAVQQHGPDLAKYPDPSLEREVVATLAERLGVEPKQIFIGNGSSELIGLLVNACVLPGEKVLYARHSFAAYKMFASFLGAGVTTVPANHKPGIDLNALVQAAEADPAVKLVYIDNPNNPTGTYLNEADVSRFLSRMPPHVVVVLDGAYEEYATAHDFADGMSMIKKHARERLVVLRTLSKCHGLASLRFGYGVARAELAECLNTARFPYSVNAVALTAAKAAVSDAQHIEQSRTDNARERDKLSHELIRRGFQVTPSQANFLLVDFHRPGEKLGAALQTQGVTVRPVGNYGLPTSQRITVGNAEQNEQLLQAIDTVFTTEGF